MQHAEQEKRGNIKFAWFGEVESGGKLLYSHAQRTSVGGFLTYFRFLSSCLLPHPLRVDLHHHDEFSNRSSSLFCNSISLLLALILSPASGAALAMHSACITKKIYHRPCLGMLPSLPNM